MKPEIDEDRNMACKRIDSVLDLDTKEFQECSRAKDRQPMVYGVDTCVCCGAPVPEGRMVCPVCEHTADEAQRTLQNGDRKRKTDSAMSKKYRKRTVEEAIQWTGGNTDAVINFVGAGATFLSEKKAIVIQTAERFIHVRLGDYIIRDPHGVCRPCPPEIFWEEYEEVRTDSWGQNDLTGWASEQMRGLTERAGGEQG